MEYQLLKAIRGIAGGILGAVCLTGGAECWGQIVINEVVKEQRDGLNDGASINPDVREFIELYNAGNSPVDLTGWTINQVNITNGASELTDTIPSGMLPAGGHTRPTGRECKRNSMRSGGMIRGVRQARNCRHRCTWKTKKAAQ